MPADFDVESYFTPSFTPGFSDGTTWYRPWRLANLNLQSMGAGDILPGIHQYVPTGALKNYADGLRAPIKYIEIVNTLDQGSSMKIIMRSQSDRDMFELVDAGGPNKTPPVAQGQMLPRMEYHKYRAWRMALRAAEDGSMPSPQFTGVLTDAQINVISDIKIANVMDGIFDVELDFESWDSFPLSNNKGAPTWYHQANNTTDFYHLRFTEADNLTYNQIITKIVAWMNQGKPTTDMPISYSFSEIASSPYNISILDESETTPIDGLSQFTNGSKLVVGTNTEYLTAVSPDPDIDKTLNKTHGIKLDADGVWVMVASVEDDTHLTLTENYAGTGGAAGATTKNLRNDSIIDVEDNDTWKILRAALAHMGAKEKLGKKYIPKCSQTGVITIELGGFDKDHAADEDFRTPLSMQYNTNTAVPWSFDMISVAFTAEVDNEYWILFRIYNEAGTEIYNTGYEHYLYDELNKHQKRVFKFIPLTAGTYKWDAVLATPGSFEINTSTSGTVFSVASYTFIESPMKVSHRKMKTFVRTRGACQRNNWGYSDGVSGSLIPNILGCRDGGATANGGNGRCPDFMGLYPDPDSLILLTGTVTFTQNSSAITGTDTLFLRELAIGQSIKFALGSEWMIIASIESNTALTLTKNRTSVSVTGECSVKPEPIDPIYGIIGSGLASYAGLSNLNNRYTLCKLNSRRLFECHRNLNTKVRHPMTGTVIFNDGHTTNLVGSYLELWSPELAELIIVRVNLQKHLFKGKRLKTIMEWFRI